MLELASQIVYVQTDGDGAVVEAKTR